MTEVTLYPNIDLLTKDFVLIQAWKKTSAYIRQHNWYSDTLELDRAAVNLPQFLGDLSEQLKTPDAWNNDPIRIVPAPKSQRWKVDGAKGWQPTEGSNTTASKLRPLAHVTLKDQVAATALMLCLADRVESIQGDPRLPLSNRDTLRRVTSYGNRLYCDRYGSMLRHRWGSTTLYRSYYQDYQTFVTRPEIVADATPEVVGNKLVIVQSDLRQFYDRVRPNTLFAKVNENNRPDDDPRFFELVRRVLNWSWAKADADEVAFYAQQASLAEFSEIALPQGLVSSGFFANIALIDFDAEMVRHFGLHIVPGVRLVDACRYVDDLRLVLSVEPIAGSLAEAKDAVASWLQIRLDISIDGLQISTEKTRIAELQGSEQPLVKQSRKMARIQTAVSGGFDAVGGDEILDAIQGLVESQRRYSEERAKGQGWPFAPIPDVRDATVARFAAGRYRRTYRSLRPLLESRADPAESQLHDTEDFRLQQSGIGVAREFASGRTQLDLDNDARAFALGLIESWVEDPSNVRLLRIGLDLWPAADVLREVLNLLRPFTVKGGLRKAPRRVAWYCLSEILRAGATETGLVDDHEAMPHGVNVLEYRSLLAQQAVELLSLPPQTLPWYLKQQALLFLASFAPSLAPVSRVGTNPETRRYRELIQFLKRETPGIVDKEFVTLAILARRSFQSRDEAVSIVGPALSPHRLDLIAERDPSFGLELIALDPKMAASLSARRREDLCLDQEARPDLALSRIVLGATPSGKLRNELSLLSFVLAFLERCQNEAPPEVLTPGNVEVISVAGLVGTQRVQTVLFGSSRATASGSMYLPPSWAGSDRWRYQLGYLLRFILSGREDFTKVVRPPSWREQAKTYRPAESHWYQRIYGLFNGQPAFGDDWLPISEWMEHLLFGLLSWPGCRPVDGFEWVASAIPEVRTKISERILFLETIQGVPTSAFLLPLAAPHLAQNRTTKRPLRACIVQTVIPNDLDFANSADLTLSTVKFRKRHRNHLSAALAAVERSLILRETHKGLDGRLDWLILPELSVHPSDIKTHLVPFARKHKCIIFAGLVYQQLIPSQPLVNSAIWIVPVWNSVNGLQVVQRRQGKQHLAPAEQTLNIPIPLIHGFRPCQWIVGYEWSHIKTDETLKLTGAICYDATDLILAANLRDQSDVFAIAALNKDVGTFDQMAQALHYHMFQMVVVVNNGSYGGSNAYAPYKDNYRKQILHMHGQPQAAIGFFEIDNISHFLNRPHSNAAGVTGGTNTLSDWKSPPVGI